MKIKSMLSNINKRKFNWRNRFTFRITYVTFEIQYVYNIILIFSLLFIIIEMIIILKKWLVMCLNNHKYEILSFTTHLQRVQYNTQQFDRVTRLRLYFFIILSSCIQMLWTCYQSYWLSISTRGGCLFPAIRANFHFPKTLKFT